MNRGRIAAGALGAAMTAAALVPVPVQAAAGQASAACSMTLGTVTVQGDHKFQKITATTPVTAGTPSVGPKGLFPVDQVRLATSVGWEPDPPVAMLDRGYVVMGTDLYRFSYATVGGQLDPDSVQKSKVGGGWIHQTYLEQSTYYGTKTRSNAYALQGDVVTRWTVEGSVWRSRATYTGFSAVKTLTLISQTATYDTFLANTRGGALYTIRIPLSGKPVVKKVRASTWQTFETLIAEKCGSQSTLLLAIDRDTRRGYLYAVSHANGTATVIKGLGRIGDQLAAPEDKTYFRRYPGSAEANLQLYGE
ncbi:hypothetical protein [Kribbella speibonae]|uniref:Uncharacterized protein n=1 Tax=Kribbella speibonae TaxID=1572660 RepID=A0A4R0IKC3_9ACTN|nr:hypothetical protein [Kribbella speibonae]TCC15528.1 hypothetical protein E0H58_42215 [Kribbella speibonae]TCC33951.1 hypothetical protein E0H92_28295 [Kribbella speibonae]